MGCCVIGALILSRWIYGFERARTVTRRLGSLFQPFGFRQESWNGTLAMFDRGRPLLTALVAAEVTALVAIAIYEGPWALAHGAHILAALQAIQSFSAPAEIVPVICATVQ